MIKKQFQQGTKKIDLNGVTLTSETNVQGIIFPKIQTNSNLPITIYNYYTGSGGTVAGSQQCNYTLLQDTICTWRMNSWQISFRKNQWKSNTITIPAGTILTGFVWKEYYGNFSGQTYIQITFNDVTMIYD